jgi:hypothetical protein
MNTWSAPDHPCPEPQLPRRQRRDGLLWACECGRIYVHRFRFNYAGEWWEWVATGLRTAEESQ